MQLENDLSAIPPHDREVVLRSARTGALHWFGRLALLCSLTLALLFLPNLPRYLTLLVFGHTVPAVVQMAWSEGTPQRSTCHLDLGFEAGGLSRVVHQSRPCAACNGAELPTLPSRGELVALRVIGSGRLPRPMVWSPSEPSFNLLLKNLLFPALMLAASGFFGWFFVLRPTRQRALLREGVLVHGVIRHKHTVDFKGTYYLLDYTYQLAGGSSHAATMVVDDEDRWRAARLGARTPVFYDPDRPDRSVAYAYCPYRIVGFPDPAE